MFRYDIRLGALSTWGCQLLELDRNFTVAGRVYYEGMWGSD